MNVHRIASTLMAIGAVAVSCVTAMVQANPEPAPGASAAVLHQQAVTMFRQGQFSEAYERFHQAADLGHAASAQAAVFMLDNGPSIFGARWSATEAQQRHWRELAGTQTRQASLALPAVAQP